jgi:predicted component of type VI protein secretion system
MYRLKGASGPVINQVFRFEQQITIGSDASCDIHLAEPNVAGRHAQIVRGEDGNVRLTNLDPERETLCNGIAVTEQRLRPGDEIRIGACRWLLQAPGMRPERVLTEAALAPKRPAWPWLLPIGLVLAGWLAWSRGWLPF